ncbi:MAG: hypothetical protein JRI70_05110 [Deltaproteobacteria bacterium]|nr:hypothetical protein [Deltaproteobacteria bacterium]MBW2172204.1 hypothetical protein [Deltaproteobacteria bacterium]
MSAESSSMREMVTMILDAQFHGLSEQDKTELVRQLRVAVRKEIDALTEMPYENRLSGLVRLFDDVKPLAHQLLWEEFVSQVFYNVPDQPSTRDVSKKRLEQGKKGRRIPKEGIEGTSEMGCCV